MTSPEDQLRALFPGHVFKPEQDQVDGPEETSEAATCEHSRRLLANRPAPSYAPWDPRSTTEERLDEKARRAFP
jgi:hypothetical protein